jgi:prevent-host-death family protein
VSLESVSVTDFKKQAGKVIDKVVEGRPIALLRHNTPEAVLICLDDYFELVDTWRARGLKRAPPRLSGAQSDQMSAAAE